MFKKQGRESEGLQDRPLSKPLDLSIHFPSKHQTKHLEITDKGPHWMTESGRKVSFNEEMTVPSKTIAGKGHKEHKPPLEDN